MQDTSFKGIEKTLSAYLDASFTIRNALMAAVEGVPFDSPKWLLGADHIDHKLVRRSQLLDACMPPQHGLILHRTIMPLSTWRRLSTR